jgi:hypothetical protein
MPHLCIGSLEQRVNRQLFSHQKGSNLDLHQQEETQTSHEISNTSVTGMI